MPQGPFYGKSYDWPLASPNPPTLERLNWHGSDQEDYTTRVLGEWPWQQGEAAPALSFHNCQGVHVGPLLNHPNVRREGEGMKEARRAFEERERLHGCKEPDISPPAVGTCWKRRDKTVCVTRARLGILCARVEYRYLTCGGTGFVELNFRNPSMEAHGFELTHTDQP